MALNRNVEQQLIDLAHSPFKTEIGFYTHPDVQTTAHAVSVSHNLSWSKKLSDEKIIPPSTKRYIELERTFVAFYTYLIPMKLPLAEAYPTYIAAQKQSAELEQKEILTLENFEKIYHLTREIIGDDEDIHAVLMFLIIYSDLGKSPQLKTLCGEQKLNISLELDTIVGSLLTQNDETIAAILPTFNKLSPTAKKMLKEIYPLMQACFGHLLFLERGVTTLQVIANGLQKNAS